MRVGFVCDDTLDRPDGVQQVMTNLGNWLTEEGHEVAYFVGETSRTDIPNIYSLSERSVTVGANGNHIGSPNWFVPVDRIDEALEDFRPDVLHVQVPHGPFLADPLVRRANDSTAVVANFNILPKHRSQYVFNRLAAMLTRRSIARFDAMISLSPPAAEFGRAVFGLDSTVIPSAIDLREWQQAEPLADYGDSRNVVFLGRLEKRKGCSYLLDAYEDLQRRYPDPDVRLLIAGRGPEDERLRTKAKTMAAAKSIEFLGFVPEEIKPGLLRSAELAVFPSTGGESLGVVLLEAMAARAGLVLAGNNPGYRSVLGEIEETLIDPKNPRELAWYMNRYLRDVDEQARLHCVQQEIVSRYDKSQIGPQVEAVYDVALQAHDRHWEKAPRATN